MSKICRLFAPNLIRRVKAGSDIVVQKLEFEINANPHCGTLSSRARSIINTIQRSNATYRCIASGCRINAAKTVIEIFAFNRNTLIHGKFGTGT
jgi:hypothetical protein